MHKTLLQSLTIFLFAWGAMLNNAQAQSSPFITRWDLSKPGGAATTLTFGVATAGTVSYTWQQVGGAASGSGTFSGSTLTITNLPANAIIDVSIDPTNFQTIIINNGTDGQRLTEIKQWGTVAWTGMQNAFWGCSNMALTATDTPNFTAVTNMSSMFRNCSSFNQSVSNFNTPIVTNMDWMFSGCRSFNQSVSNFNTENVTDMSGMFSDCRSFNQSVSNFNTAAVTNTSYMFSYCNSFNQSVNNFNTTAVTDMSYMFQGCRSFNQSVSNFNTENVTDMSDMFYGCCSFNQSVSNFNTQKVTKMTAMFSDCIAFNQSVSNFNIKKVTDMSWMFSGCSAFNQSLASWGLQLKANAILTGFLSYCGMSITNYDATLTAFAAGAATSIFMNAEGLKYCNAETARTLLKSSKSWTILGDTKNCSR